MAFSTKVTGIGVNPAGGWVMDNIAWKERELMKDSRFRVAQQDPGYISYVAVLSPAEALALHKEMSSEVLDHQRADMRRLGERLARTATLSWVLVDLYEW